MQLKYFLISALNLDQYYLLGTFLVNPKNIYFALNRKYTRLIIFSYSSGISSG